MGMDLSGNKPKNQSGSSFHFNWAGWRFIGELLDELGCDTSEMSGANDGDRIKATTCKEWAKAIKLGIDEGRIYIVNVKDKSYSGGFREQVKVLNKKPKISDKVQEIKEMLKIKDACPLKKEDADWIMSFVTFLENCGGCRQF